MGQTRRAASGLLREYDNLMDLAASVESRPGEIMEHAKSLVHDLKRAVASEQVATVPIGRLRETAKGLRLEALERGGYKTLGHVLAASEARLTAVNGVGPATARQILAAAHQVQAATERAVRLHFDIARRPDNQAEVLGLLQAYDEAATGADGLAPGIAWLHEVGSLAEASRLAGASGLRRLFTGSAKKAAAASAAAQLEMILRSEPAAAIHSLLQEVAARANRIRTADEVWSDYEHHAARLLGVLAEVTDSVDAPTSRGHLTNEIIERVQAQHLDTTLLRAGLRGYQAFAAKYALVQQRTILGDEMGLGKTVEALAVLCHLRAAGADRAVVVCPASVVANWRVEIARHTKLRSHVLHGDGRGLALRAWQREGGVAITTFDGLKRLEPSAALGQAGGMTVLPALVVDEAHYAKNPETQRSRAVARWAASSDLVMFLTGTPMENRVDEFKNLVEHLRPDVARTIPTSAGVAGASAFRAAVAPVYLRRNQTDVLNELPERIESLDWVEPTTADLDAYREAVGKRQFMAMRRAAFQAAMTDGDLTAAGIGSCAKLARLTDIIAEATTENLKVVVFSYFRDVLELATRAAATVVPGRVHGPLTGSVVPARRQAMVDALGAERGPSVLTAQIEAGGVGLNIQAASVVVLCEPQWKPTTEAQAIARCHRMGQVRRVQVHRLVTREGVDPHMLAILAGKSALFDEYVVESVVKSSTPDAIDVSDLPTVDRVVKEAEAERRIVESERRRLGLV